MSKGVLLGVALVALVGVLAVAGGGSKPKTRPPADEPTDEPEDEPEQAPAFDYGPGKSIGVFSLAEKPGVWCGQPVIRKCTSDFGATVSDVPGDDLVWGWTPPGDLRAAEKYGGRLIADIETRASTKAKPSAGWVGSELQAARELAGLVHGVTSHGYVAPSLKQVLQIFAEAGAVAFPQVYDTDRSEEPREFLRKCLDSYQRAGFSFIVPLLGASAGPDYLRAWIDECRLRGVPYALWSLQRLQEKRITCEDLVS